MLGSMDYTRLASVDDLAGGFRSQGLFPSGQGTWHLSLDLPQNLVLTALLAALVLLVAFVRRLPRTPCLLDIHCFTPPERLLVPHKLLFSLMREKKAFSEEAIAFQEKIAERSGMGDASYVSDGIIRLQHTVTSPTHQECLEESQMVIFDCVEQLLAKTGVHPREVDAVMVSCSCFAPTPSMAAMLVNRFKFREDVLTYNLSGMGCSSSLICVDLAKHLLKVRCLPAGLPRTAPEYVLLQAMAEKLVLIVNHENITRCRYNGEDRTMLLCNSLFRIGGAAVFMTNRAADANRAKYTLRHTVRSHLGANDEAFSCMGAKEDAEGLPGVFLLPCVVRVAGLGLSRHLARLGRLVLPLIEKAKFLKDRSYIPRFNACFEHYLMHTGGRGVLDSLAKEPLALSEKQLSASRQTLARYGNTSAASTWYVLARLEQDGLIKKGDRLWQLGFGGGFKANSAVWTARRNIQQDHSCWAAKATA